VKVGCAGFPIGQDRYWRSLSFVEARTGETMPRPATLSAWRAGAPAEAEFSVQAYRLITHGPDDRGFPAAGRRLSPARRGHCGAFRESLEVHEAWLATKAAAETLGARIAVFETPASFQPGPDRLRDMYRFFKGLSRGKLALVWQPRGAEWDRRLEEKVCGDLGLVLAVDPLRARPPERGAFRYLRPLGPRMGGLSVDSLSTIRAADEGQAFVVLTHRDAFRDAERLSPPPSVRTGPRRAR
jgi:uncharacterized protein YecE (DUF72 family)